MGISRYIKSADRKVEKYVLVTGVLGQFVPERSLEVEVAVGKEIPHPNLKLQYLDCPH